MFSKIRNSYELSRDDVTPHLHVAGEFRILVLGQLRQGQLWHVGRDKDLKCLIEARPVGQELSAALHPLSVGHLCELSQLGAVLREVPGCKLIQERAEVLSLDR